MSDFEKVTVTINGREYHSLEEVPPDLRSEYALAMQALRDFQAKGKSDVSIESTSVQETFVYNGKRYQSREELPPEARAILPEVLRKAQSGNDSKLVINPTKILPEEVVIRESDFRGSGNGSGSSSRWIVVLLVLLVLLFLFLWLAGVKPSSLLSR